MELIVIDPAHPDDDLLDRLAEAVLRGGIVAFPTDTLYGLHCSLFDIGAVQMIARLKRRDPSLAVISLIPETGQAYGLASEVSDVAARLMATHWPGPRSLIVRPGPLLVRRGTVYVTADLGAFEDATAPRAS